VLSVVGGAGLGVVEGVGAPRDTLLWSCVVSSGFKVTADCDSFLQLTPAPARSRRPPAIPILAATVGHLQFWIPAFTESISSYPVLAVLTVLHRRFYILTPAQETRSSHSRLMHRRVVIIVAHGMSSKYGTVGDCPSGPIRSFIKRA
jgi:hypothetical protein